MQPKRNLSIWLRIAEFTSMVCVCELSVPVPMPVEVTLLVNVKKIAVPTYSKKLPVYNERDAIVTSNESIL
jgi:hypothetical protein